MASLLLSEKKASFPDLFYYLFESSSYLPTLFRIQKFLVVHFKHSFSSPLSDSRGAGSLTSVSRLAWNVSKFDRITLHFLLILLDNHNDRTQLVFECKLTSERDPCKMILATLSMKHGHGLYMSRSLCLSTEAMLTWNRAQKCRNSEISRARLKRKLWRFYMSTEADR